MKLHAPLSALQINYLRPLKKWRILSLKDLQKACGFESSYVAFARMMLRLERRRFIGSFYDPFNRRKYLYLTKEGSQYVDGDEEQPCISKDTLVHDSKVVEIILEFMRQNCFYGFELEHEIAKQVRFADGYKICPDANLFGEKKGQKFKLALELELTRKTKAKFLNKIGLYLNSNFFDYVLYFFHDPGILNSYKREVESKFGPESNQKILWALNTNLLGKNFSLANTSVVFKQKEETLNGLFA